MPADSILHAFTLSPALPRRGGGSGLVAVLQDVMIYEKLFRVPLSKCHSRLARLSSHFMPGHGQLKPGPMSDFYVSPRFASAFSAAPSP